MSNDTSRRMSLTSINNSIRSRRRHSVNQTNGTIAQAAAAASAIPDGQANSLTDPTPTTNEASLAQLKQQVCIRKISKRNTISIFDF